MIINMLIFVSFCIFKTKQIADKKLRDFDASCFT
jgi:hypothetical protein